MSDLGLMYHMKQKASVSCLFPVFLFPVLDFVLVFVQEFYFVILALYLHFALQHGDVFVAVYNALLVGYCSNLVAFGIQRTP